MGEDVNADDWGTADRRPEKRWIIAGAAVLLCAVLACVLLLRPKTAPAGDGESFDAQIYQQEVPKEAGRAYIDISHRTGVENSGGTDCQMYDFTMTEKNGVGFSISQIESKLEGKSGGIRTVDTDVETLAQAIDPNIAPFGSATIIGGFPKGEFKRLGITVFGQDANQEPMTFYHLIEF